MKHVKCITAAKAQTAGDGQDLLATIFQFVLNLVTLKGKTVNPGGTVYD